MEEQLINLETAKLAREKGFNVECRSLYRPYTGDFVYTNSININPIHPEPEHNDWYSAPTQTLLQKWLREIHGIKVYLIWYDDEITKARWSIYVDRRYVGGYSDYESALEEGLYEGLKLIK